MHIVALEGPAHAGKSTLAKNLASRLSGHKVLLLPDYFEVATTSEELPDSPLGSLDKELAAFHTLLALDRKRTEQGVALIANPDVIIMDRSIHTLLAHRFSLTRMTGLPLFEESCQIASHSTLTLWPNLVLYIDVPQALLEARYARRTGELPILLDPVFNEGFRTYFLPQILYGNPRLFRLDGSATQAELTERALVEILLEKD